jgi:hypothetical protein
MLRRAGDTANSDELKNDLEKYEHLQKLSRAIVYWGHGSPSGTLASGRGAGNR